MRALAATLLLSFAAQAAPFTWTGAAGSGRWLDAGNWSGGAPPPDDGTADVVIAAGGSISLDGARTISTLSVSATAAVTLQPGTQPQSALVLRGAGLTRSARGRLILQVPLLGGGSLAFTGFEAQTTIANATAFDLATANWPGATTVSQAMVDATGGGALPSSARLNLGAGAVLNANGQGLAVGSLAGSGAVINSSSIKASLFAGFDDTDSTFSGNLGTALSDQTRNGFIDLVKVGSGTMTVTGALNFFGGFGSYGLLRVLDGTLVVNGTVGGFNEYTVIEASSGRHGTVSGTGNAGYLWTANNSVPGATVSPGLAASHGILHAINCDLRHGTLRIRFSGYATPGVDYDQLDCGNGSLTFDSESDVVLDLGGQTAPTTGNGVPIVLYGTGNGSTTLDPSQVRTLNNPAGLVATLNNGAQSLSVSLKAPTGNSAPLFVLTPAHGLVTSERGRIATFTVALGKAPGSTVTIPIASSNPAEGTSAPASLVFNTSNWATPQTVTVTGVDDAVADGNALYQINVGPATSVDPAFNSKSPLPVSAINLDDDLITVAPTTGLVSKPLGGSTVTFTFHAPVSGTQRLLIQFRSTDPSLGWTSPALLSVNATNTTPPPQTVILMGAHQLQSVCAPYTLVPYSLLTNDPTYTGFELPPLNVCNQGNRAPVAPDVALSTGVATPVAVPAPGLRAQAFDPDGDPISIALATGPAHGSASVAADGSFTYQPVAGFTGVDSFTYSAGDSLAVSTGTVFVNVGDVAPLALADSYVVDASSTLVVPAPGLLGNDTASSGAALAAQLIQEPAHGSLSLTADGSFTYVPDSGFTGSDSFTYAASDGLQSSSPAQVSISVLATGPAEAARLALSIEGGSVPGTALTLHADVSNVGDLPLQGLALQLSPEGISVSGAAGPAGALTLEADSVLLPDLAVGESIRVDVVATVSASPGGRAGASAVLRNGAGETLVADGTWVQVSRLRFDAGGWGCASANPGAGLAWLGALLLLLARRRRRSTLPGRTDPHLGNRLVARDLRLARFPPPEGIDGDHGDALAAVVQPDLGVELSGRRDLHRLPLDVDPASREHAAGEGNGAPVGLVSRPLHGQEHPAQRGRGLFQPAALGHPGEVPLLDVHRLAVGGHAHRSAGGGHRDGGAFRGEEEVAARALGRWPVLDLEGDAALSVLDRGLDPSADARAQEAGRGGGETHLAAVVQLEPDAVDRELRLAVGGRAQRIALAQASAGGDRAPGCVASLQLDRAPAADQHRGAFRSGRRRSGRGLRARHGPWFLLAPAALRTDSEEEAEYRESAHQLSYMGARGCVAMPLRRRP